MLKIKEENRYFIALTNKGEYKMVQSDTWKDARNWFSGGPYKSERSNIKLVELNKDFTHCNERCFDHDELVNCDEHRQEAFKSLFDNGITKGYGKQEK